MISPYLERPLRALWKAQADTGRADYFRWTFKTGTAAEIILSVGKKWRGNGIHHAASVDTCEVLLWETRNRCVDLLPSEVFLPLEPFDRYFSGNIACHMPDSILDSFIYALGYYFGQVDHKATRLKG